MPVVVMGPTIKHCRALPRVMVRDAVGPLTQSRLNEPFRLAIGLWAEEARELMMDSELGTGRGEAMRAEGRSVVGQDAMDLHPEAGEILDTGLQEGAGAARAFISLHLGETETSVIVDRNKQTFPTDTAHGMAAIAGDPMTHALDAGELLCIDVHHIARMSVLVAQCRLTGCQIRPSRQSRTAQHSAHRAGRHLKRPGNPSVGQPAAAQLDDP